MYPFQFTDLPSGRLNKRLMECSSVTRVVLWPEYAEMEDGDVLVHVEIAEGSKWKTLATARRCQRRLKLRLEALAQCSSSRPEALLRKTGVYFRKERRRRRKIIRLVESTKMKKEGYSVQVAAHVRGDLYVDVMSGGTVDEFMDWLETLGMPTTVFSDAVEDYERHCVEKAREQREQDLSELVATLIGSAAQDVAFGPLKATLKAAAATVRTTDDDDDDEEALLLNDAVDDQGEDLSRFGRRAYDTVKSKVFRLHREETRTTEHVLLSSSSVLCRIGTLVEEERLDLRDIFLASSKRGRNIDNGSLRVSYAELRRGLARLLASLPCDDHTQYLQ